MATSKKAGETKGSGRAAGSKAKPAEGVSAKPSAAKASAKGTESVKTAASKSPPAEKAASTPKPAAKKKSLIAPGTAKIAKEVAAKAVSAVKKKVEDTVSSLSGKSKKTAADAAPAARKPAATKSSAKAEVAADEPKKSRNATPAAGKKMVGAAEPAPAAKAARGKAGSATPTRTKRISKTASGALAPEVADEGEIDKSISEFSGSESFRREDEITDRNPVDVKEKFFHEHRNGPPPAPAARELPNEYGDTKIVLLVRDPEWVYAYWEINDDTRNQMNLSRNGHSRRMVIRLYKISERAWPREGAHYFFDIDVSPYALNWYIKLPEPGQQWCAELGTFDENNTYVAVCRSNTIGTPRNTISEETDSEWMVVEETFRKLSNLGGPGGRQVPGLGASRGASESLLRQLQRQVTGMLRVEGGGMSSGSMYSGSLVEQGTAVLEKDFWLQVHTELILYGATEADARVTVQGKPVKLGPDGRFSLRFDLPDGEQVLHVHATSSDGEMERSVTPVVVKRTRDE